MRVAVLFGGRSPEHEVSIITGIQVLNAARGAGYETLPIYIGKGGSWFLGGKKYHSPEVFMNLSQAESNGKVIYPFIDPSNSVVVRKSLFNCYRILSDYKIDVYFPAFHGRFGEDGAVQGFFELIQKPYVGCNVQASSIGMDKYVSKKIAESLDIPVLPGILINSYSWNKSQTNFINEISNKLSYPLYVKPARLGSSIGLLRVNYKKELRNALEVASHYDSRILVEEGLKDAMEVNISIIGNDPYEFSVTEQPIHEGDLLTFEDKYMTKKGISKGMASAKRIVPAPIKEITVKNIKKYSRDFFHAIGGSGLSRIDFLVDKNSKEIYFNEINTMPGSVAYFLWKDVGLNFSNLVKKLIHLALEKKLAETKLITTFESNILKNYSESSASKL